MLYLLCFAGLVPQAAEGTRYRLRLNDAGCFPDPASRYQPDGPSGASQVMDLFGFQLERQRLAGCRFKGPGYLRNAYRDLHERRDLAGCRKAIADLEHDHILQMLKKTGWCIEGENGAAGILGLNASTFRARMRKYGIIRH